MHTLTHRGGTATSPTLQMRKLRHSGVKLLAVAHLADKSPRLDLNPGRLAAEPELALVGPSPLGAGASPGLGVPAGDSGEMVSSLTSCVGPAAPLRRGAALPPRGRGRCLSFRLLACSPLHSPRSLPTATAGGGGRQATGAREARVATTHRVEASQPGADHLRREPGTP